MKFLAAPLLILCLMCAFSSSALANPATVPPGGQYLAPHGAALITNNGTAPIVVTTTQGTQPPHIVGIVIEGEDDGPAHNVNVQLLGCGFPTQVVMTGNHATLNHAGAQTTAQVTGNPTTVQNATSTTATKNAQGAVVTTSTK